MSEFTEKEIEKVLEWIWTTEVNTIAESILTLRKEKKILQDKIQEMEDAAESEDDEDDDDDFKYDPDPNE